MFKMSVYTMTGLKNDYKCIIYYNSLNQLENNFDAINCLLC